jgi:hypothetical protein
MELVEFWALTPAGVLVCPLPDVDSWTISPVANDAGAAELVYPVTGLNWATLHQCVTQDRRAHVQVRIDGVIHPELQITLFEANGDDVAEDGTWSYRGWLPLGRLRDAVVKPKGGMPAQDGDSTIEQDAHYYSCTAGTIMATCMVEAQGRGALTGVTYASFTGTHDSNGVTWSQIITLKFTPGIDLLKVVADLVEAGMCDARMVGNDLRLYEPGTLGVDRTLTTPPLVFRKGQSLIDSPRKHTTAGIASAALVAGGEGEYQWVTDAAAQTRLGQRIETSVSQGSITDPGTLTAYAQHWLEGVVTGKMQKTHGGTLADGPVPIEDFDCGDWSWSDLGSGLERLRVAQWALSMASDGTITWTAVLNDLIAERDAAQAHRLQGIEGGTTISGTSNARQIPDDLIDGEPPEVPDGATISITSLAYITDEGTTLAAVTVEWDPVLLNSNGTAMTDLSYYSVYWRYQNPAMRPANPLLSWTLAATTGELFASFSGLRCGEYIDVRIGATDAAGNFSGWSVTVSHLTASDTAAPPTPSALVATAFIGSIKWEWNGLGSLGEPMPADFAAARIHISTVNAFTPTSANLYDTLPGPGAVAFTNATYGTTYYGRVVLVDTSGNTSSAGAVSSAAPRQILNPDIATLSIGSAQIIDLDVGKVTAGTINSPWIIGSSIHTAASGPRFGMNTAEFFAYRADGTKTVSITNAGAASFLGEIRTAPSGARIVINPAGSAPAEMRFYPTNNSLGKYISLFTSDIPGGTPGYSLTYLKGDRYAGLPGEAVLRMWYYEASFGWFDAAADILSDEESAFYARMYSCGINSSTILHTAHGLRESPYHEFAFALDLPDSLVGMGRMKRDVNDAFIIGCPAKGSALAFQGNWLFAVAEGNTLLHVGFTASTVTQSSGRASKTNIGDIDTDVLAVLDGAPAKRWEYRHDHENRTRSRTETVRRRKRVPEIPLAADPAAEVDAVLEVAPLPETVHRRWGPMAEDLPDGVVITSPVDGTPLLDHGSMLGLQWEILRELHRKVKKLERAT